MKSTFATFLAFILMSVYRAEVECGHKEGKKKQKQVLHDVHLKAAQLGIIPSFQENFDPGIIDAITAVIKAVVALLNLLGIFRSSNRKG